MAPVSDLANSKLISDMKQIFAQNVQPKSRSQNHAAKITLRGYNALDISWFA
jgi:hypothetical protein